MSRKPVSSLAAIGASGRASMHSGNKFHGSPPIFLSRIFPYNTSSLHPGLELNKMTV